jgi:hypothetical protein
VAATKASIDDLASKRFIQLRHALGAIRYGSPIEPQQGAFHGRVRMEVRRPYQEDLRAALEALHDQVFRSEDFVWYDENLPSSLKAVWTDEKAEGGTHSIPDLNHLIDAEEPDRPGRIRPLTSPERLRTFGTDTPSRSDFDRVEEDTVAFYGEVARWSVRCTVLYHDGRPEEIPFWGVPED